MILKTISPKVQGCYVPLAIWNEIQFIVEALAED
jgi:hypothetical protein